MSRFGENLPIAQIIRPLLDAISTDNDVILQAAPGAGKSTLVPLMLLRASLPGKILLMQPRRVVVRSLARFLAEQCGDAVGETVGYRIKGETRVSRQTQIEVITEGVLAKLIQSDPELHGVSLIIFDEFHERSIHSDYGLALAIEVQQGLREDLRLLVMSATFNTDDVSTLLPKAVVLHSEGRQFPIDTHYVGNLKHEDIVPGSVRCVMTALLQHEGDILLFLPGAKWIHRAQQLLSDQINDPNVLLVPLYGALSQAAQQQALIPAPSSHRKVILSTNIAETSLTLPGITVVIDSGREQQAGFHAASGLTQLSLQMISQASAMQRQGRAGRLQAGHCYRLWGQDNQSRLAKQITPQILTQDITAVTLDALAWGTQLSEMAMLTQPTKAQAQFSQRVLLDIAAIDKNGHITPKGRQLSSLPISPQNGAGLLSCQHGAPHHQDPSLLSAACYLIAWVEEGLGRNDTFNLLDQWRQLTGFIQQQWLKQAKRLWSLLADQSAMVAVDKINDDAIATAAMLCFPDRIAKRRHENAYTMTAGSGAKMLRYQGKSIEWLVVLAGQFKDSDVTISLAVPIDYRRFEQVMGALFKRATRVRFDKDNQRLRSEDVLTFQRLVLQQTPSQQKVPEAIVSAWLDHLAQMELQQWPMSETAWQWYYKLNNAKSIALRQPAAYDKQTSWPEINKDWLLAALAEQGQDALGRCIHLPDLAKLDWVRVITQGLSWPQQDAIKQFLPSSLSVPSGQQRQLTYLENGAVKLSVKMQEMYGLSAPILLADKRLTVTVELLNPAGRPIQTTQDLGGFWRGSYIEVQKEMKGRYPKHYWPDDPASAQATTKVKSRM